VPRRKTTYKLPAIDEAAFLRRVAWPDADPAPFAEARGLAESVENPLVPAVVAAFWESSAPEPWIDGRAGNVPRLFLDRGTPPMRSSGNAGRRLHGRPTSLELAASLAADPVGVATAQEFAEEFLHRMRDWCDAAVPSRVAWGLADPRLYSYGAFSWERADEYSTPFWLGNDVLRAQGAAGAKLESSVRKRIASLARKELARRGWERAEGPFATPNEAYRDAQRFPTSGLVVEHAAFTLGDWLCTRAAAPTSSASIFNISGIRKLQGRRLADLPDPLDPLLSLYGTGYFPMWIEPAVFVIGVPWSGPAISAATIYHLWATSVFYDEDESLVSASGGGYAVARAGSSRWDGPSPTVTGALRRGP